MKDPIVEEVRAHRMEHTLRFGGDMAKICEDLRALQQAEGYKVVRLPAKQVRSVSCPKTPVNEKSRHLK